MDKTWKAVERRVARMFGTERTPMSGGNSKHTRADTLHDSIFIEIKHRKNGFHAVSLLKETIELAKLENKIPLVVLVPKGDKPYFVLQADPAVLRAVADSMETVSANADSQKAPTENEV